MLILNYVKAHSRNIWITFLKYLNPCFIICISTRICAWIWVFQVPYMTQMVGKHFVPATFCPSGHFVPLSPRRHCMPLGNILDMSIPGPYFGHILSKSWRYIGHVLAITWICTQASWHVAQALADQTSPDLTRPKSVQNCSKTPVCEILHGEQGHKNEVIYKKSANFWANLRKHIFWCFYIYKINRPKGPKYHLIWL